MNVRALGKTLALVSPLLFALACGDDDSTPKTPGGGGSSSGTPVGDAAAPACPAAPVPEKPAASCDVAIESHPVTDARHLPEGTQIAYCSNPPSGGDHYPVWADFKEYNAPIEWPYLVHSMEHGAVLLLYKCDSAGCPDIVAQLRKLRDEATADPRCAQGIKRIIIAPSTTILTKVAASAWGKTYQAPCVDEPTLAAFIRDNYAKGPEDLCAAGRSF